MATEDIKEFLSQQTGIAQSQWKRLSKHKMPDGSEVRVFQDKASGMTVQTIEDKKGVISLVDDNTQSAATPSSPKESSQDKQALSLVKKYYKNQESVPDEDKPGFALIPKYFKFSFFEDSNVDHPDAIEEAAHAGNPKVAVTGFNLLFSPTFKAGEEVIHLAPLLEPFLPHFLSEVEEATFCVHAQTMHIYDDERLEALKSGEIPSVPYDRLIATLEQRGFTYDIENCMMASLGGSQGAESLQENKNDEDEKPRFCIVDVKNPCYEPGSPHHRELITALVVEAAQKTTRKAQETLVNKTLKKYTCVSPGRLINAMLPQLELLQIVKKSSMHPLNDQDKQNIHEILTENGWSEDISLASEESAKQWTLEQWAVTPMGPDPFTHISKKPRVSDHASEIEYGVWSPAKPRLKP